MKTFTQTNLTLFADLFEKQKSILSYKGDGYIANKCSEHSKCDNSNTSIRNMFDIRDIKHMYNCNECYIQVCFKSKYGDDIEHKTIQAAAEQAQKWLRKDTYNKLCKILRTEDPVPIEDGIPYKGYIYMYYQIKK